MKSIKYYFFQIFIILVYFLASFIIFSSIYNIQEKNYLFDFFPFNCKIAPVGSGSMEPYIKTSDVCIIKKISQKEFKKLKVSQSENIKDGDIIVFKAPHNPFDNPKDPIIHRVVFKNTQKGYVNTQGDNNKEIYHFDKEIYYQNVVGKNIFHFNRYTFFSLISILHFLILNHTKILIKLKRKKNFLYYKILIFLNSIFNFVFFSYIIRTYIQIINYIPCSQKIISKLRFYADSVIIILSYLYFYVATYLKIKKNKIKKN